MRLYRTVLKILNGCAPGVWGGTLGAVVLLSAILLLPGESCAAVDTSVQVSYQTNESSSGGRTSSSTQQRIGTTMNINSQLSSKLRMTGLLRFDVIMREVDPGTESTELQPNVSLRFATNAFQLNTGYRQILRDETIVSGSTSRNLTSESSELVADSSIRAGKLPNIRLRYSQREQRQENNGAVTADSTTDDARGSFNYKLGIFALNADYGVQSSTNNISAKESENTNAAGQISANKAFSTKVSVSLRENYIYSTSKATGTTENKRTSSTSEARLSLKPVKRSALNTSYVYRVQKANATTTESRWFTNANYAFPKFFRFYGSYSMRQTESGASETDANVVIYGLNFSHKVGKFNMAARYERRADETTVTSPASPSRNTENTRDNIDWLINANLSRYFKLALSESYVVTSNGRTKNENTRYRIKADFGPIKDLTVSPYIDYAIAESGRRQTTTTEIVVPAKYQLRLGSKVRVTLTDNYRIRTTESQSRQSETTSNNAVVRIAIPNILKSTSLSGDASFNNTSTKTTSSSTSAYTLRVNWANKPHRLGANFNFQTGSNRPDTISMGAQYGLSLRMKKVSLGFNATYRYAVTQAVRGPDSTNQSIFLTLSLRN